MYVNVMTEKDSAFLKELHALLKKYNASVNFTCGENSDTHGLYDDHLEIRVDEKRIFATFGWDLDAAEMELPTPS